jgi:hypothetical protein
MIGEGIERGGGEGTLSEAQIVEGRRESPVKECGRFWGF